MYEEEEDELPSQYKNLNAHLHTGSTDFDARLQAYLANAVAFRKALSGVAKNRDKSKNVDFVNTKQLADHKALFPKHSDAWKDIIIPKVSETSSSPFLPQGTSILDSKRYPSEPYNSKASALTNRRLSVTNQNIVEGMDSMGTLKPSDLKVRTGSYRQTPRHPSLPQPKVKPYNEEVASPAQLLESAGINYASLDRSNIDSSPQLSSGSEYDSPFSSKLPANAIDMLLPWSQESMSKNHNVSFDSDFFDASLFHPRQQDTIDATLLAPTSGKTVQYDQGSYEYAPQSISSYWNTTPQKDTSVRGKLVEDNMWSNFIDESSTEAWDWSTAA